jgi:hypothetical protein
MERWDIVFHYLTSLNLKESILWHILQQVRQRILEIEVVAGSLLATHLGDVVLSAT